MPAYADILEWPTELLLLLYHALGGKKRTIDRQKLLLALKEFLA